MDVLLLGTGSADGWPNPFCRCASCTAERLAGRLRGQTAALVDGRVLLDCGPETPPAAQRAGADLADVRHVLLTHAHPDHCAPAFLLFRSWAQDGPMDVVGPPEVVEAAAMWVAPDSPVRFRPVAPGDRLALGGYDVRVLAARHGAAGSSVLYDLASPSGRLLYGTDTGPLPEPTLAAVRGARFDVVLLEETFGDHTGHGTDHLDLASFPEQLRRLGEAEALTPDTDVVAVHLSHHNPPTEELSRRLADWGARVVDDGTTLARPPAPRPPAAARRTLVVGGARSGKSREAERLLAAEPEVTYVATGYTDPDDAEWAARVREHRSHRPAHWRTVETTDLVRVLAEPGGAVLVDCLTLWLTRVMDTHDAWHERVWSSTGEKAVQAEVDALVAAWRATARRVVAVSNEVGQGVVPETAAGRRFRDTMGRLNAALAAETEDVRWCAAGRVLPL
ncbi:MAG TPA: bifunctional adenosylcobinamide kinase/adenosylcobinamide-phosphate guanylyltransferase [Nocardioidaceae bacterium]